MLSCRPLFTSLRFNRLWALHPTTFEQDYHYCSLPSFPICEPLISLVPFLSVAAVYHGVTHCRGLCQNLKCSCPKCCNGPRRGRSTLRNPSSLCALLYIV